MKMNRLICLFTFLFTLSVLVKAQIPGEFVGLSFSGGNTGAGTVYSITSEGNNLKAIYHFTSKNIGENPQKSDLCLASNGKFYGVTTNGGTYQAGVLFEYDPATKEYIARYVFDKTNGESPYGGVIEVNGTLFGTTRYGGSSDAGTIFTYTLSSHQFVKIYNCLSTGPIGYNPCGALVLGSGGKVYGITRYGGGFGLGTIFEIDPATTAIKKIIDVPATMGRSWAGLTEAGNARFYGVTVDGGANNLGTLFEFNPSVPSITKKIDFDGTGNGKSPYGSLVLAANGKLYGTTSEGGANDYGTLFEYSPDNNTLVKKIDFGIAGNGQYPYSALYKAPSGSLFGVTSAGGKNSAGVLFKYNVNSGTLTKLYDFNAPLGYNPQCGISRVGSALYSLTLNGGKTGSGTIFKYDTVANVYSKEIEFNQPDVKGSRPYGGFEKGLSEKYYFVTSVGGANGVGTLNVYDRNTKQASKIYDFEESTGSEPDVEPTLAENNKLYGTTLHGGVYGNGTIYEYDLSTGVYKKLYDFVNSTSGISPAGSKLVYASNKKIYGLTLWGGTNGTGVLFEFNPATVEYTVKASMPLSPGYATIGTWSGMTEYNGKLYLVTSAGGSDRSGILFEYDPVTGTLTNKVEFTSAIGSNPYGGISVFGKKFYGTCNSGGANNAGSIFEYNPANNTLTAKYNFTSANKSVYNSPSRLTLSGNNKFYGSTMYGGQNGYGGIFEFDPSTSDFKVLVSFDGTNGISCPTGGSLIGFCDPITISQQTLSSTHKTGDVLSLSADATGTNLSYKWIKDNSVVSSTKTFSKVLSSADFGKYICKVTNGCRIVDSDTVRITLATGIPDTKKADQRIYPNPCKGTLYSEFTGEIEIFNGLGQTVKKQLLESSPAEIDLSLLDDGVYYYRLKSDHQTFSGKFVLRKE